MRRISADLRYDLSVDAANAKRAACQAVFRFGPTGFLAQSRRKRCRQDVRGDLFSASLETTGFDSIFFGE